MPKFDNDMAYFETFRMERDGLIDNESAQIQRTLLWQMKRADFWLPQLEDSNE